MRRKILNVLFVVLPFAAILVGCSETPPLRTNQTNNPNYQVKLLFENEGCKVYKFNDDMQNVYYTDCRGSNQVSMNWEHLEGKIEKHYQSTTVSK